MSVFDEREGFIFYRSYYDSIQLLPKDDRIEFLECLLTYQFTGQLSLPTRKFAKILFTSQLHAIKKQVVGFQKGKNTYPTGNPTKGKRKGSHKEGKGEGEDKDKEQEQGKYESQIIGTCLPSVLPVLMNWLEYKRQSKHKYTESGLRTLIKKFNTLAHDYSGLESLVENSIMNGYQGIIWDRYQPSNQHRPIKRDSPI